MARDGADDRPRSRGDDKAHHRSYDRTRDRSPRRNNDRRDATHAPKPRNDRSRSPRRERGGRRADNNRYRSRSPLRRDEREAPKGPRGAGREPRPPGRPTGPRSDKQDNARDSKPESHAPVKPIAGKSNPEDKDVKMGEPEQPEGVDDETWEMLKVMGFARFKTTKETKVPGNDKNYAVRRDKRMEARQYMNRQGGFNRPLSPGR